MTEFYAFAGNHPILVFFLAGMVACVLIAPFHLTFRYLKHRDKVARRGVDHPAVSTADASGADRNVA